VSGREIRAGLQGAAGGVAASLGIDGLEVYKMTVAGPCAFCTFQPVARVLRATLGFLHMVTFDWAIAVILLVVVVRTVLHPVTRWSQKNLQRFGKQMAALAPKQAKLKERYKDDPKKLKEEIAKLIREENINYAGALGCVPIFLQMPIWIALYAMVFFTFELRHDGGFYGVFQAVTGGAWGFMGDLAEPDHFVALSGGFYIPGLRTLMGDITGINLLPLLLGVVFWFQQKYMTPPSAAPLTPEQETTQKITKALMVIMLPLFMYNAPAALSLYFMTNSVLGIFESKWIRAQVEREDAELEAARKAAGPRGAAPPAKMGFMQRLQAAVEARQKELEAKRRTQGKGK
jgi:YidC/Oxa1 family membrane protein insertase